MEKVASRSESFMPIWTIAFLFYLLTSLCIPVMVDCQGDVNYLNELERQITQAGRAGRADRLNKIADELIILIYALKSKLENPHTPTEQIGESMRLIRLASNLITMIDQIIIDLPESVKEISIELNRIEEKISKLGPQCQADAIDNLRRQLQVYQGILGSSYRDPSITDAQAQGLIDRIRELKRAARSAARGCRDKRVGLLWGLPGENAEEKIYACATTPGCILNVEENYCRTKQKAPNDPYYLSKGSWGQAYDDQWAIKHVGFTADKDSAWNIEDGKKNPVVVAVIDSGLDWNHLDVSWDNIWRNPKEIPDNGKDDDNNGYVDDTIGWNFMNNNNKPWDEDGHGTFITGIIAAATNNGTGIAGINHGAKIMVLKALNTFGHTRASFLSEALFYAANNGARVINISVGGPHLTKTEQEAIDYAHSKGAVIVVASGNEAVDTADYSPSGLKNVIAVSTTDEKDKRAGFSNWGQGISLAAPGMDVLSLRARRTDLMLGIPGIKYSPRLAYVGKDTRYYRASGSSFSAPIVSATASLIFAKNPKLTNTQVERMLLQSARDVEVPGWDQYTGFGLLDARAALQADPEYYLTAQIQKVQPVQEKGAVYLEVLGSVEGSDFSGAAIDVGLGERPEKWEEAVKVSQPVREGRLGLVPATKLNKVGKWSVRLQAMDKKGKLRESRASVDIE